jgi:hypothetical protein
VTDSQTLSTTDQGDENAEHHDQESPCRRFDCYIIFGMGKFVGRRTEDGYSVNTALAYDF